jgi:hypothetical protein
MANGEQGAANGEWAGVPLAIRYSLFATRLIRHPNYLGRISRTGAAQSSPAS